MSERPVELSEREEKLVNARIREELARRRISRQTLADDARISLSTLEKALSGQRPFTLATLIRLEEALSVRLRSPEADGVVSGPSARDHAAGDDLGGYSRSSVTWLEGSYVTLRPSFGDSTAIFAYRTDISWSVDASCLVFQESDRLDQSFTQEGRVSVPSMSGHIYLITNKHGQHRLIVVSRPAISGEMYGILTTLQAGRGANLMPVATAVVLVPERALASICYGRIRKGQDGWKTYSAFLQKAVDDAYVTFYAMPAFG